MAMGSDVAAAVARAAEAHNVPAAALQAVVEVESGGKAFAQVDGRPMPLILYEYHVFHRYPGLPDAVRREAVRRNLAAPKWGDIPYKSTQSARYAQLYKAAELHEQAAYAACSWGVGQVLGENAEWLGFGTPKALAERAMSGIDGQLEVMMAFVVKRRLLDELQQFNWRGFARVYNGPGQVDHYSTLMARAYRRIAGGAAPHVDGPVTLRVGATGEAVASMQRKLRGLGYFLTVDGDFGPATLRQLKEFQKDHDLTPDGVAGPMTLGRLDALTR